LKFNEGNKTLKMNTKHLGLIFRRVRWQSPSSKSVEACPRCGSLNIQLSSKFDIWLTPRRYVCRDCGYMGPIVLEIEENEEEKEAGQDD